MPKVSSSEYLRASRPLMEKLLEKLRAQYAFCSILASDCYARRYNVSGRGISTEEDVLLSGRGFVICVRDERGCAEYSLNRLSEDNLDDIMRCIAEELLPLGQSAEPMEREIPDEQPQELFACTEYEIHPAELGDAAILERLTKLRETGKAADPRILDCVAVAEYQEIHKIYLSAAKDLEQNLLWTTGTVVALAGRGQEIKESYQGYSMQGGAELFDEMEQDVSRLTGTALELLDSEPIAPGEYDCICDPSVTGMIVHEAFGHGVEMDMFVKDRAQAKSFIGQYVASPLVTMHDGAACAAETGSYFFDDEGTPAHDTVVIEKGILKRGISDLLSAGSLGTEPTGNGRRESFERKAYTRMTNTYFEGGTDKVEDMIASVPYGFLLQEPSSGMEDPKNWGIQCMVTIAREIRDGKLTGKIFSPIVLTGYVPDLLKSITMMSETVQLEGGGYCGKGHKEYVKVSDGGPYMKARIRLG